MHTVVQVEAYGCAVAGVRLRGCRRTVVRLQAYGCAVAGVRLWGTGVRSCCCGRTGVFLHSVECAIVQ